MRNRSISRAEQKQDLYRFRRYIICGCIGDEVCVYRARDERVSCIEDGVCVYSVLAALFYSMSNDETKRIRRIWNPWVAVTKATTILVSWLAAIKIAGASLSKTRADVALDLLSLHYLRNDFFKVFIRPSNPQQPIIGPLPMHPLLPTINQAHDRRREPTKVPLKQIFLAYLLRFCRASRMRKGVSAPCVLDFCSMEYSNMDEGRSLLWIDIGERTRSW